MKHSFKENLISFAIGCCIGLPVSLYAVNHQAPAQIRVHPGPSCPVPFELEAPQPVTETEPAEEAPELTQEELDLLARCVEAEAGNQGLLGKQLVVDVVLNRVDDPDYPGTVTEVIMQPRQFSVVLDGRIWEVEPAEETFQAIRTELRQRQNTGILFFTAEGFSPYGTAWKKVGDHYFSVKRGDGIGD